MKHCLSVALLLASCAGKPDLGTETGALAGDDGTGTDGTDGTTETDGTDGTDGPEPSITATLSGTVAVQLYCDDADGQRQSVSFAEAFGGSFPFGKIWVAAYTETDGRLRYVGADTIDSPTTGDNAWSLQATLPEAGAVQVLAILDRSGDRILSSFDPIGNHPEVVEVSDGSTATDVGIDIVTDAQPYCSGGGSDGGSEGGSGGGGGSSIVVDGPVTIGSFYSSGDGAALLLDNEGQGPFASGVFTPDTTSGSPEADYSLRAAAGFGTARLVGVIDSSGNDLFDGLDTWGTYVVVQDIDANPILIGSTDLPGLEIQIPLAGDDALEDGESPLSVVPYTSISGTVGLEADLGSTFDSLPAGTTVYVAALKYRPSTSVSVTSIEADAYDHETFEWADLTGNTSVAYDLVVPANTAVYLWAYADEDADGNVNESGEAVASGGTDDNGRQAVTTVSINQDFLLGYAED